MRWEIEISPSDIFPKHQTANPKPIALPKNNSLPLKKWWLATNFLLGRPIFRVYVSFKESKVGSLLRLRRVEKHPMFFVVV